MEKYSDAQMVTAIKEGGRALDEVMRFIYNHDGYRAKVFRFVRSKGGQVADAEDVFQDGIRALILSIRKNTFRAETSIEGYLFSVCRNLWFKQFNKETRYTELNESTRKEEADFQTPEAHFVKEERKEVLQQLLASLGDTCKKVLELWKLSYSMKEIAAAIGYGSEGMARKKKHQCMQRLVKAVQDMPGVLDLLK